MPRLNLAKRLVLKKTIVRFVNSTSNSSLRRSILEVEGGVFEVENEVHEQNFSTSVMVVQ